MEEFFRKYFHIPLYSHENLQPFFLLLQSSHQYPTPSQHKPEILLQ
jgi:hypothetical protein